MASHYSTVSPLNDKEISFATIASELRNIVLKCVAEKVDQELIVYQRVDEPTKLGASGLLPTKFLQIHPYIRDEMQKLHLANFNGVLRIGVPLTRLRAEPHVPAALTKLGPKIMTLHLVTNEVDAGNPFSLLRFCRDFNLGPNAVNGLHIWHDTQRWLQRDIVPNAVCLSCRMDGTMPKPCSKCLEVTHLLWADAKIVVDLATRAKLLGQGFMPGSPHSQIDIANVNLYILHHRQRDAQHTSQCVSKVRLENRQVKIISQWWLDDGDEIWARALRREWDNGLSKEKEEAESLDDLDDDELNGYIRNASGNEEDNAVTAVTEADALAEADDENATLDKLARTTGLPDAL